MESKGYLYGINRLVSAELLTTSTILSFRGITVACPFWKTVNMQMRRLRVWLR